MKTFFLKVFFDNVASGDEVLDKSNIIPSRRTRGKRIDYSKFGKDETEEEEEDE
jgi:hypothetical protein